MGKILENLSFHNHIISSARQLVRMKILFNHTWTIYSFLSNSTFHYTHYSSGFQFAVMQTHLSLWKSFPFRIYAFFGRAKGKFLIMKNNKRFNILKCFEWVMRQFIILDSCGAIYVLRFWWIHAILWESVSPILESESVLVSKYSEQFFRRMKFAISIQHSFHIYLLKVIILKLKKKKKNKWKKKEKPRKSRLHDSVFLRRRRDCIVHRCSP